MNIDTLSQRIRDLEEIRAEKEALEDSLEGLKEALTAREQEVITAMMDIAEASGLESAAAFTVIVDGRKYGVSIKSFYSIKADSKDLGHAMLRELGLGDLIKESVDSRVLTKTLNSAAEDNNGILPDDFAGLPISVYEKTAITRRKA